MRIFIYLFFTLIGYLTFVHSSKCYSQVAINSTGTLPSQFAMLDINSSDKGVLVPRINLVDTSQPISGAKPIGLFVWNDNAAFDKGKGFYFWTGAQWHPVVMKYKAGSGITIDSASHTISSMAGMRNAVNIDGIVPAPTNSNRHAQYKTDFNGNPAWRKENKTNYYIENFY